MAGIELIFFAGAGLDLCLDQQWKHRNVVAVPEWCLHNLKVFSVPHPAPPVWGWGVQGAGRGHS